MECLICGQEIPDEDASNDEKVCWLHEPGCDPDETAGCECSLYAHTKCCPICNPKTIYGKKDRYIAEIIVSQPETEIVGRYADSTVKYTTYKTPDGCTWFEQECLHESPYDSYSLRLQSREKTAEKDEPKPGEQLKFSI